MVPNFLLEGVSVPDGSIAEQLAAAQALAPEELIAESGQSDELRTCAQFSYYHFWMNALQHVGIWAEVNGQDGELPAEFWIRLAQAAVQMQFPEFLPYFLGKAKGLGVQDPADVMAAVATLPEVGGGSVADVRATSRRVAALIRQDAPEQGPLLDRGDLAGLSEHLRAGAFDRLGDDLSTLFSDAFDELFAYVTAPDFPEQYRDHFWAIAGANQFVVQLGGQGDLFALTTRAEVWWRVN